MERYKNKRMMFRKGGKFAKAPSLKEQGYPVSDGNEVCAHCGFGSNEPWRPILKTGYCPECEGTEKIPSQAECVKSITDLVNRVKLLNMPDTYEEKKYEVFENLKGAPTVVVMDEQDAVVAFMGDPNSVESFIQADVLSMCERQYAVKGYKAIVDFINTTNEDTFKAYVDEVRSELPYMGVGYLLNDFNGEEPKSYQYKKPSEKTHNWRVEVAIISDIPVNGEFYTALTREGFYRSETVLAITEHKELFCRFDTEDIRGDYYWMLSALAKPDYQALMINHLHQVREALVGTPKLKKLNEFTEAL